MQPVVIERNDGQSNHNLTPAKVKENAEAVKAAI